MNRRTLFSVIIPVCNGEAYLPACLDSVRSQTLRDLEVIVVDDGSCDGSPAVCRRYAGLDSRIRYIRQENAGVSAARNRGLEQARGEWILFVDSDDLLPPDICRQLLAANHGYDLMLMRHRSFCGDPPTADAEAGRADRIARTREDWLRALLGPWTDSGEYPLNPVWAKAYRRSFLLEHAIAFPEQVRFGEDLLFNLQVFLKEPRVCGLPVTGYCYRRSPKSLSHGYRPDGLRQETIFRQTLQAALQAEGLDSHFAPELEWWYLAGLLGLFSGVLFHRDNPGTENARRDAFLALIARAELLPLLTRQGKHFPLIKRGILHLAARGQYRLLRLLYALKRRI